MKITHANTQYYLPKGIAPRMRHRRMSETPEPQLVAWIERYLKHTPGTVIHAGAFSGDLLPQLSRASDHVYAWEPVSYNHSAAIRTLKLNRIRNCTLRNAALSNTSGELDIVVQFDGGYLLGGLCSVITDRVASPLLQQAQQPLTERVAAELIDSYTYEDLRIIHLDLEGWELAALKGAANTVAQHSPVIILEDTEHSCDTLLAQWDYVYSLTVSGDRVYMPNSAKRLR